MKIGVISDTHNFLDPNIAELFAGVSHILHAGDVGNAPVIAELEAVAPVTAVYGNTDMNLPFKETEVVELADRKFLVHHIVNPFALAERLKDRIARERPDVVVFGHTHQRFCETVGGIFFSIRVTPAGRSSTRNAARPSCTAAKRNCARNFCRCDPSADCAGRRGKKNPGRAKAGPRLFKFFGKRLDMGGHPCEYG